MKNACLTLFIFICLTGHSPGYSLVNSDYKTLNQQIKINIDKSFNAKPAQTQLATYLQSNNPEIKKGMKLILQEDIYNDKSNDKNYALYLLLYMLSKNAFIKDDSISMALVLANNYLYSIADINTQREIKKDIIKHFIYYKKILAYQKTFSINYNLSIVPLIPKICWAYRVRAFRAPHRSKKLDLRTYREFIDRIETLEQVHRLIKKLNLNQSHSLLGLAAHLESFVRRKDKLCYRAKINVHEKRFKRNPKNENSRQAIQEYKRGEYEKFYFGKKRRWDLFQWLNYQMRRYQKGQRFKGDCVTATTIQMNLYKALGIPSFANQIWSVNPYFYHHNSPFFYNVFFQRWNSIQTPSEDKQGYYNYFYKPIYHHKLYELYGKGFRREGRLKIFNYYWPGEKASYTQVVHLRKKGIENKHLEKIFFSRTTQQSGFIFNTKSAPVKLNDDDGDGILNKLEKKMKLNPKSIDSDNDGFADLWEIEMGHDPLNAQNPPKKNIVALDGISKHEISQFNTHIVYSPANDYNADTEIHDVKSLTAKQIGGFLYVAVSFYNDITKNKRNVHTLRFIGKGKGEGHHYFQWVRNKCKEYVFENRNGKKKLKFLQKRPWEMAKLKDAEFLIPLSYFKKYQTLFCFYQSTGIKNGKKSNHADYSKALRIELIPNKRYNAAIALLKRQKKYVDPKNDYKGKKNIYDLKSMRAAIKNKKLYIGVDYYNDPGSLKHKIHTIDLRDSKNKKNAVVLSNLETFSM